MNKQYSENHLCERDYHEPIDSEQTKSIDGKPRPMTSISTIRVTNLVHNPSKETQPHTDKAWEWIKQKRGWQHGYQREAILQEMVYRPICSIVLTEVPILIQHNGAAFSLHISCLFVNEHI